MIECGRLAVEAASLLGALHGAPAPPVPHWLLLLVVVPGLWCVVGGAVLAIDRLLQRFGV
ncbi:hypothetical protein [Halomicrobium salinisoli]|uniref:hypothetical protein n=1 Tax=Halomicrobium salinisoli TaxID=2878391 RepID=UPI001CEFF198|nr:hypothetical protein [Halomicrobium salinisoli]